MFQKCLIMSVFLNAARRLPYHWDDQKRSKNHFGRYESILRNKLKKLNDCAKLETCKPALNQQPSRFCIYLAFIWHSLLGRPTVAELDVHYIQHHSTHLSTEQTGPAAPSASRATLHSCSRILRDLFMKVLQTNCMRSVMQRAHIMYMPSICPS